MSPKEAAAKFAAFTWYVECRSAPTGTVKREAKQFAKESWRAFLPVADEGWGRLLLRLAKARSCRYSSSAGRRVRTPCTATAFRADRPVSPRQSWNRLRFCPGMEDAGAHPSSWTSL